VYKPTDDKKVYCTEDVSNIGLNKIQTHFVAIINTDIVFLLIAAVSVTVIFLNYRANLSVRNFIQINLTRFRVLTAVR